MSEKLLEVNNLETHFFTENGEIPAVDNVSFTVDKGETLGIVGESGSGKSVTSLSIMRLLQEPAGRIVGGEIIFNGENLVTKKDKEMCKIRGNRISMIFQEPMTALNPVYTIGSQVMEVFCVHQNMKKKEAFENAVKMLKLVGIPSPEQRMNAVSYTHLIDYEGMRTIAGNNATTPYNIIPDGFAGSLGESEITRDLDKAKELMAEAGYADGFTISCAAIPQMATAVSYTHLVCVHFMMNTAMFISL